MLAEALRQMRNLIGPTRITPVVLDNLVGTYPHDSLLLGYLSMMIKRISYAQRTVPVATSPFEVGNVAIEVVTAHESGHVRKHLTYR